MSTSRRLFLAARGLDGWRARILIFVALAGAACGRGAAESGPPGGAAGGGPPAMPVEVATLEARPIEQTTEFLGRVRSQRSTTIQPQVEGFITRIAARSGDRVRQGSLLMEIDSGPQQAAVASLDSQRLAREADLVYLRQQAERLKGLHEAGAVSLQEFEQAQSAMLAAEAQLKAVEAQIREQRLELGYHRVIAPTAGVVGDIPVRVGERVTSSTVLTAVVENAGLELYINVPVEQAVLLKSGLPVRLVDGSDKVVMETAVTFVSPEVDAATQSVLVKAALENGSQFRTDELVRARIVWSQEAGVTVPLVAVNRVSGQYFAFVAEPADGGTLVARQRPVELGPLVGNDYVVRSGLKPGERLIVSGIQKIGDGMPVQVAPPRPPPGEAAKSPAGEGQ